MKRALFLAAAALLGATPALAAEAWQFIIQNKSGVKIYVDPASIQRDGSKITFWQKWDLTELDKPDSDNASTAKYHAVIDCASRQQMLLAAMKFDSDGKMIKSFEWPADKPDWRAIPEGSVGATLADKMCNGTFVS